MQAGKHLLAVEYDDDLVAAELRARCASWLTADEREVPAAFGIRMVKVGFLRRSKALLHHGAPIRARFDTLDDAVDVLVGFLHEIEQVDRLTDRPSGHVAVDARAFVRRERAVLLHAPASVDVDERQLAAIDVDEIHSWCPLVDPSAGTVTIGLRSWPLHGVTMIGHHEMELDDARRHAWALGTPGEVGWAELLDSLGDGVRASSLDVHQALDEAFD
jgi:hypothetical protein